MRVPPIHEDSIEGRWSGKPFWSVILLSSFITLGLSVILNIMVDPFGIYGTELFPVVEENRYADLLDQMSECSPKPGVLVIGNSRVDCIDPHLVTQMTGRQAMNCWGPGAAPELFYATLRIALEEFNFPVEMVIVGIVPGALLETDNGIHPQARTLHQFMRYVSTNPDWLVFKEKTTRLFTFEQTNSSLELLWKSICDEVKWYLIAFELIPEPPFIPDLIDLQEDFEIRLEEDIRHRASLWDGSQDDEPSFERMSYWDEFLRICAENGIIVYVYTQPAHPGLVERFYEDYDVAVFREIIDYIDNSVTSIGGTFKNYNVPEDFGGDPRYFRDAVHMTMENGNLLVLDLLSDVYRWNPGEYH